MATKIEIARLAAAINLLRSEWPTKSLQTFLEQDHAQRPIHELGVALTWIALDPDSKTPKRLNQAGPWWVASRSTVDRPNVPPCQIHGQVSRRSGTGECQFCHADRAGISETVGPGRHVSSSEQGRRPLREAFERLNRGTAA